MREILFRGKTHKGEWVQGDLYHRNEEVLINNFCEGFNLGVVPETVGQYTGLTDKNGTKIFEGDIVRVEYTGVNKGLNGIAEVIFDKCKFALVWGWHKEIVCLTDFCNVEFEVIGNIHDNPKLLESEVQGE